MKMIIVLTKASQGNDVVGDMQTIAREFDEATSLGEVFNQMQKLGNWDIIIPKNQITHP